VTTSKLSDFKPFDPAAPSCSAPALPKSVAYFVPEANEYFTQLGEAMGKGVTDHGGEWKGLIISDSDPVKNIDQMDQAMQAGIGALLIQPQDAAAQAVVIQKAIDAGIYVYYSGAPAITQGMALQYNLGYDQAIGAVEWIKANLGGKAKVAVFSGNHVEILIPRHEGTLAGLATGGPDIEVVVEQDWDKQTTEEGFALASTIYQAHPDINVWIGPDDTVLGVDAFLKSKQLDPARDKILASGLNGTPTGQQAVASGTSFVREVYGFSSNLVGYAAGAFAADWLNGKHVPLAIETRVGRMGSKAEVDAFNASLADPKEAFARTAAGNEPSVRFWGNICHDTKEAHTVNNITDN
jgi:ribose transport system substrate-binding protein